MKENLLFCPLGGSGEIGMNMNLYAYGTEENQKWIIVDMGVTFADDSVPGVDLIYPDAGFIIDKKEITIFCSQIEALWFVFCRTRQHPALASLPPSVGRARTHVPTRRAEESIHLLPLHADRESGGRSVLERDVHSPAAQRRQETVVGALRGACACGLRDTLTK